MAEKSKLKRRAAPQPEPEKPAKKSPAGLKARAVTPETVAAALAGAKSAGGGSRIPYLKMVKGDNTFRVLPGEPMFVTFRKNTIRTAGKFRSSASLDWVFGNPEVHEAARSLGKVTDQDFALYQQVGDPFVYAMEQLKAGGVKVDRPFWPQTRVLWNVLSRTDGKVYVWETSSYTIDAFSKLVGEINEEGVFVPGEYPELFDAEDGFDVIVSYDPDEAPSKRYSDPRPARRSSSIGEHDPGHDLVRIALNNAVSWRTRAQQLLAGHGAEVALVGITAESLGLSSMPVDRTGAEEDS